MIVYERTTISSKLQIVAKKSLKRYHFDTEGKDRLFFIRLSKGDTILEFPYSHQDQAALLKCVIENDILLRVKRNNINKFRAILDSLDP